MKVLFVNQGDVCIRTYKEAYAVANQGVDVYLACHRLNPNFGPSNVFNKISHTTDDNFWGANTQFVEDVAKMVEEVKPDIIHTHNRPDWFVPIIKQMFINIPLIHDVHDLDLPISKTSADPYLYDAIEWADAIISPSDGWESAIRKKVHMIPNASISYIDHPRTKLHCWDNKTHCVYIGNFYSIDLIEPSVDYIVDKIKNKTRNVKIHIRSSVTTPIYRSKVIDAINKYRGFMDIVLDPAIETQYELSNTLSQYDIGLITEVLNKFSYPLFKSLTPDRLEYSTTDSFRMCNKLFDYSAAGLPILGYLNQQHKEIFKDHLKTYDEWDGYIWRPVEKIKCFMVDYSKDIIKIYKTLLRGHL